MKLIEKLLTVLIVVFFSSLLSAIIFTIALIWAYNIIYFKLGAILLIIAIVSLYLGSVIYEFKEYYFTNKKDKP